MDAEVKQRNRRRKRAQRMQAQRDVMSKNQAAADSNEDEDESPIREKPPRPPIRRKKSKEPLVEEDIIDGFAVLGFKTYEDLETVLKLANKENVRRLAEVQDRVVPPRVPQLPQLPGSGDLHRPAHHITHHISAHAPHSLTTLSHHDAATSDDSGRASERLTGSSVAPRDADSSRDRLSDASSRCSSGKGYICDSEGEDDKGSDASSVIFGLGGLSAVSTTTSCATVTSLSRHTKPQHLGGNSAAAAATTTASNLLGPSLPSVPSNLLSNASSVGSPIPAPTPPPAAPAPSPAPAQGLVVGVGGGGDKMVVADKGATSLTTRLLGPTGMGVPTPSAAIPNIAGSDMDTTPTGAAAGGAATATARGLDMAATGAAPPPVTPNSLPSPAPAASVPASTASLPVSSTPMTVSGVGVCGGGTIPPNMPSVPNPMHLASASINATAAAATPVTSHPHPPTALDSTTPSLGGISAAHAHHARTDSPAVASIATSAAPSYHPTTAGYHHHHHHHPQQLQQQQHQMQLSATPQLYTPYAPHVTSTSAGYGGIHTGHHMQQHPIHQNHHHHPVGLVGSPSQQSQQQMGATGLTSTNVVTIPRSPGAGRCHSPGSTVRERDNYGLPPRSNNSQQLPPTPSPNTPGIQLPPHPSTLSSAVNTAVSSSLLTNTSSNLSSSKPQQPPPPSSWPGLQPSIIPPVAPPASVVTTINSGAPGSVQNIMGPPPRHHSPASVAPNSTGAVVSTLPNPYSIPSMFPAAVASMNTAVTTTTSGSPSIVTAHTPIAGSGGSLVFGANGTSLPPCVPPTPAQLQPPTIPPTQPTQPPTVPPPPLPFSAESLFSQSSVSSQPAVPPPPSTSQTQADLLRRELDNRFLASTQDRGAAPPPPPYLRTEMHQHQHHHTHVHQHTTSLLPPGAVAPTPGSANLFPAPLFKDIPKMGSVESPFYRQSSLALPGSYGAYGAGLLHPGLTAPAGATPFVAPTHLPAFQPKVRVFNKSGKWNAMHVRVAWEIYHHQHKGDKPGSGLKADLLRPPTHLFNPSVRAHELGSSQPPSTGVHQYPQLPGNMAAAAVAAAAAAGHRPPGAIGIPPPGAYDAHHGSLFTSPAGLAAAVAAQHHHQQQQALAAGRTALSPFTRYSAYPPPPGPLPPPPTTSPYQQHPSYTQQAPPGSAGPPPPGPPHRTADLAAALLHDPWRRTYTSLPPPVPSGPAGPPSAPWGMKTSVAGSASEALLNLEQQQKVAREREQREREEREERERIRERQRREDRERREREEKQRRLEQQQQEQRERDRREKERRDHERRELERERERVERERQLHQQRIAAQQAAAAAAAAAAQAAAIDQKPSLSSLTAAGAVMRDRSPTISMRNGGLVYNHISPFPHSPTSFLPGPDDTIRIKEEPRLNSQLPPSLPPTSNSNIITNHNLNPKHEEEASASLLMRNAAAAAAAAAAIDPRYHPYLRPGPPPPHMSLQPQHLSRVMPPPPHHAYGAPPGAPGVHGWGVAPPDPYFRSDHLRYYNPLMDAAILRAEEERAKLYSAAYGSPLHHPSSIAHAHAQAAAHAHAHAAQLRAKDSAAAAALMHMRGPPGSTGPPLSIASGGPLPPPTSVASGGIAPANHKCQ